MANATSTFTTEQWVVASIAPKTAAGNVGSVTNATAVSSDNNIATVAQFGTDPLNFKVVGKAPGSVTITFTCKNTAGTTLTGTLTATINQALVVSIDIVVGQPQMG